LLQPNAEGWPGLTEPYRRLSPSRNCPSARRRFWRFWHTTWYYPGFWTSSYPLGKRYGKKMRTSVYITSMFPGNGQSQLPTAPASLSVSPACLPVQPSKYSQCPQKFATTSNMQCSAKTAWVRIRTLSCTQLGKSGSGPNSTPRKTGRFGFSWIHPPALEVVCLVYWEIVI
jgi:hypothetical protein